MAPVESGMAPEVSVKFGRGKLQGSARRSGEFNGPAREISGSFQAQAGIVNRGGYFLG